MKKLSNKVTNSEDNPNKEQKLNTKLSPSEDETPNEK